MWVSTRQGTSNANLNILRGANIRQEEFESARQLDQLIVKTVTCRISANNLKRYIFVKLCTLSLLKLFLLADVFQTFPQVLVVFNLGGLFYVVIRLCCYSTVTQWNTTNTNQSNHLRNFSAYTINGDIPSLIGQSERAKNTNHCFSIYKKGMFSVDKQMFFKWQLSSFEWYLLFLLDF